eukprot:610766-Amphidinium_carterae.1
MHSKSTCVVAYPKSFFPPWLKHSVGSALSCGLRKEKLHSPFTLPVCRPQSRHCKKAARLRTQRCGPIWKGTSGNTIPPGPASGSSSAARGPCAAIPWLPQASELSYQGLDCGLWALCIRL